MDPGRQGRSRRQAGRTACRRGQRTRPGPRPSSVGAPRARSSAPPTGGTGGSPGNVGAPCPHGVHLMALSNWKGEQAIRPAVVNRKSWGGNFSWAGADTQEVLSSVLATARLQGKDPISVLVPLLRSATPRVADLILPGVGEGEWRQIPQPAHLARPARAPERT